MSHNFSGESKTCFAILHCMSPFFKHLTPFTMSWSLRVSRWGNKNVKPVVQWSMTSTFCNKFQHFATNFLIDIWWSEVSPPTLPMRQIFSFWKKSVNHYTIRRWCHKNVSMRSQQSALIQSFYCKEINLKNSYLRHKHESYLLSIISRF